MAENGLTPPYGSFGIFKATIEQLSQTTVPSGPLDRRVLDQLSGADYGALISGFKFLGLVDGERRATEKLRELVQVSDNPQQFRAFLLGIISEKYTPIVGTVDTDSGTASELEKAFRDNAGVPAGQMLTKTVRFFVKALQESGIEVSPHITKAKVRTPTRNGGAKPRRNKPKNDEREGEAGKDEKRKLPPSGMERMPIPGLQEAFIQYPANVTEAQCDLFEHVIGVLRLYAKSRGGKAERP